MRPSSFLQNVTNHVEGVREVQQDKMLDGRFSHFLSVAEGPSFNKQFGALGFRDWWRQANIIAEGSADQAAESRHYSRSMRLHKQSLEALLRFKASQVSISQALHKELNALKSKPSAHSLERVTSCTFIGKSHPISTTRKLTCCRIVEQWDSLLESTSDM